MLALSRSYNYGVESYDLGDFGHFGLAVNSVVGTVDTIKAAGRGDSVTRPPGPVKGGSRNIAFVKDPTGYSWELIEREGEITEPLAQVMLRVSDLDRSIKFYTEVLGCKLLRTRDNPEYRYTLAFLGYSDEESSCVFELTYNYGDHTYNKVLCTGCFRSGSPGLSCRPCALARLLRCWTASLLDCHTA